MKKIILLVSILALLAFPITSYAKRDSVWGWPTDTEHKSGDGQFGTGAGTIYSIILYSITDNDIVKFYNDDSADEIFLVFDLFIDSTQPSKVYNFPSGLVFNRDIYIEATDEQVSTTLSWDPE